MAANIMMEVLRKIQRDVTEQKDYVRNLHVIHRNINEKFNLMTEKFDQQQLTMERLEQQVKKNNTLLFGSGESDIFKDNTATATATSCLPPFDHNDINDGLKHPEKYIENIEANQLQTFNKEPLMEMEWNAEEDNKKNDHSKKPDSEDVREFVSANEMREIKDLIADFVKTGKSLIEETISPTSVSTEQIKKLNSDLKQMMSEMSEMKELFKEMLVTRKTSVDEVATPIEKSSIQTVQLSPKAYFSTNQISMLNSELKQITEAYQASNFFPHIEVVPNTNPSDDHPVMKTLYTGVSYGNRKNTSAQYYESHGIKLGMSGFKRSYIQDLLTEYPNLALYEVVKEGLKSTNEWSELSKIYDFTCPHSEPAKIRCLETVSICPAYFDTDQITKLNAALKKITEKYLKTNIFPNIEVVPNTDIYNHPVYKALNGGIVIQTVDNSPKTSQSSGSTMSPYSYTGSRNGAYGTYSTVSEHYIQEKIHLGSPGSIGVDKLLENDPLVSLYDFIKKRLEHMGRGEELKKTSFYLEILPKPRY